MKTMSKILTVIALVVLCVSLFTVQASAASHDDCPADVTYTVVPAVPKTCMKDGSLEYQECSACGQKFATDNTGGSFSAGDWLTDADIVDKAPGTPHKQPDSPEEPATCFKAGYYICTECGEKVTLPKLGHSKGTEHPAEPSTDCKKTGTIKYYDCANGCGAILNEAGEVITSDMLDDGQTGPHDWSGEWQEVTPATASHGGTEILYCANGCGASQTRTIDATGMDPADDDLFYLEATRDTYFRGEELPQFWSDLIEKLNTASGPNRNYVGVRIGTSKSMYANSYDTFDFWSSGNQITLGQKLVDNLDEGTYYIWVYNKNNPKEHTNSIPWYIVDTPTLEPINTDKHVVNSTKNLRFRASEPIKDASVKVGGKALLDDNYYYVSNDGLTITLSPDFLNERQVGTYTISANTVSDNTKVSTHFYILSTASASASPKTGDESQLGLWAAFLLLSGAAVVVLVPKIRKHGA